MASATRGESSNPYGGGLGTGGKFRKQSARKSQKTPYDRPPTSVRNVGPGSGENRGGGWLSKLVDPAQRFITYSAHKLFASVFQKRLGSGETPLQVPEQQKQLPDRDVNQETKQTEDISNLSMKNDLIRKEETNVSVDPTKDGFIDLEKILLGKTFTRSEVDRLTTLLRSKAGASSTVNEEQRNEASIVVRHPPSQERNTTLPDNGSNTALVTTPPGNSRALDELTASPAQLAKSYMGSRPSEITPSMLGLRGQAIREDSVYLNRTPFPLKSPTMSLVPRPSGQRPLGNGFLTPRSRGRSALYSMARTPYSRPQSTVKIGSQFQASPSTWEENLSSGSRQVFHSGLKRRSSVLDNDIGSVGPVRRIRQKSNFSSRSLAVPASESPLSVRANGEQKIMHTSKDSGKDILGSSLNLVPTKSSEMASKILQQLDNLVSTRDKSPSKLSPSMIHGQALKSLQNVEAPKFLDKLPEKKVSSPDCSHEKQKKTNESGSIEVLAVSEKTGGGAVGGSSKAGSSKGQETRGKSTYLPLNSSLEEHRPTKRAFRMSAHEDFLELEDDQGVASTVSEVEEKHNVFKGPSSMPNGEKPRTLSEAMHSTSYISNGDVSQSTANGSLETGRSKVGALPIEAVQQSNVASEQTFEFSQGKEKSSMSPGKGTSEERVTPMEEPKKASALFPKIFQSPTAPDLSNQNTGASTDIKFKTTSSIASEIPEACSKPTELKKMVSNNAFVAGSTTTAASTLNGSISSAGANAVSLPLANNGSLGSTPSFPPTNSNISAENSGNGLSCTVNSLAATPTTSSVFGKLPANTSNDSNLFSNSQSTSALPLSSASPFKFGEPASAVSASGKQISKEPEVKTPTFGNTNTFVFGGTPSVDPSTAKVFDDKSSENKGTPGFVFGSPSPTMADTGNNIFGGSTLNPSTTASSIPGNSGSLIFGVTSSSTPGTETSKFSASTAATNAGSNSFGISSPAFTSTGSSVFGNVAASTGSSVFGFNAASSASAASSQSQPSNLFGATNPQTTTSTQSAPFQFGSSASTPSFGMSGTTSLASNSSPFGFSKSEPAVFSSGSTPQPSLTNSSASSSSTTSSPLFGTSWQAPNSAPAFSSSFTASSAPTFNFGGSSAATGSSVVAPSFGASTNTPSSSPIFGFSSVAPTTPQQPVFGNSAPTTTPSQSPFGNSTPGFGFGTPNTNGINNNNQQASMEDSMAEDNSPVVAPVFGQSTPQPNFAFGGGSATPPPQMAASPFQFGGQPTASTPQNNPFQASSSLEFQGGGSFSLGSTGGGDKSTRRIFKAKKTNRKK